MLQALVITLREGFEAFLIVAISLSYLRKSGRSALAPAVHWGIGVAVVVSALGGFLLFNSLKQERVPGPPPPLPPPFGAPVIVPQLRHRPPPEGGNEGGGAGRP